MYEDPKYKEGILKYADEPGRPGLPIRPDYHFQALDKLTAISIAKRRLGLRGAEVQRLDSFHKAGGKAIYFNGEQVFPSTTPAAEMQREREEAKRKSPQPIWPTG